MMLTFACSPFRVLISAASLLMFASAPAAAQTYPSAPVRVIVPYGAGGATDVMARVFADYLHRTLGQPFTVENRSGGGGQIAAAAVSRAEPDGTTLFFTSTAPITIAPVISGRESRTDLVPVAIVAVQPAWLVATSSSPFKTFQDIVKQSKAHPGSLTFGTPGLGSESHLVAEAAMRSAGIKMAHVPFRGGSDVIPALLGKQIDLASLTTATVTAPASAGDLRLFAVSSPKRSAEFPDVPTYAELGHGSATMLPWWGLMASPKTPPAIVERLASSLKAATTDEGVRARLKATFVQIEFAGPKEFNQRLQGEVISFRELIRAAGIQIQK